MRAIRILYLFSLIVFILGFAFCGSVRGDIIFSQGSSVTGRGNGLESDSDVSIFRAQRFTVATATTIKLATWSGLYMPVTEPVVPDSFNIVIFGDTGSGPDSGDIVFNGAPTNVQRVDSGYDLGTINLEIFMITQVRCQIS